MRYIIFTKEDKLHGLGQRLEDGGDFVIIVSGFGAGGPMLCNYLEHGAVANLEQLVKMFHPDAIILDDIYFCPRIETLRKLDIPLIGLCEFSDILQTSRPYFQEVLRRYNINEETKRRRDAIDCTIEGWWDGVGFKCISVQLVETKMMNNDLGLPCECSGVTLKKLLREDFRVLETLEKVRNYMTELTYLGPVRVGISVDPESILVCGIRLSFGFDSFASQTELFPCSTSEFFRRLLGGKLPESLTDDFALGIRATFPPYPLNGTNIPLEVREFNEGKWKHFWAYQVRNYNASTRTLTSGSLFGVSTAHGNSMGMCRRRALETLKNIEAPALQYRSDIGKTALRSFNLMNL